MEQEVGMGKGGKGVKDELIRSLSPFRFSLLAHSSPALIIAQVVLRMLPAISHVAMPDRAIPIQATTAIS